MTEPKNDPCISSHFILLSHSLSTPVQIATVTKVKEIPACSDDASGLNLPVKHDQLINQNKLKLKFYYKIHLFALCMHWI